MKNKFLILFIILLLPRAFASSLPTYMDSVSNWGIGAIVAPREFTLYQEPNKNSVKIMDIKWNNSGELTCNNEQCDDDIFTAFVPENGYAILSVIDEDTVWANVYYSKNSPKTAWIELNNATKFYTWAKFVLIYGKRHGVYILRDVDKDSRRLYAQPEENAQTVDSFELAKYITPWFVSGNWVMVKLLHYDNKQKTGWLRWRDLDGRLWVFVDLRTKFVND